MDVFNLYLGINGCLKSDDSIKEPQLVFSYRNKTQKRATSLYIDLPPRYAQFVPSCEQLQNQFPKPF
ncbi:hypothetical protein L1987_06434 [Smallanthus sonchifolius]|uniref:Uncharacterized protein n=2 Tax=Smallanthus sonchifolius TaxID=185202 RepID=A0ACB9JY43_9ASTR|nr:hypothetical protein L1987_05004 [Smallanthus sonchifolius]KAI3824961.1 hypothetical protein L1987_06434 [Smallanthus sonchifolius]